MEGLESIRQYVSEKEDARNILNRLKVSLNQHCDRISHEACSLSNQVLDLQEGIKKNSVALKCEVEAMKKATEEGSRIEGRDQRIKIHFEKKANFIENCKCDIEKIKMDMVRYEKQLVSNKIELANKREKLKILSKEMSSNSGVCWDYDNCTRTQLKGYVVSKINTRIKTFDFKIEDMPSCEMAEKLWLLVEEVNSN